MDPRSSPPVPSASHSDSDAGSDSDNDAPIAIPHTQAKRAAKTREAERERVAKAERDKKKERNRAKERTRAREGSGKEKKAMEEDEEGEEDGDEGEGEDVEARMERAMREAAEEESDEEEEDSEMRDVEGEDGDEDSEAEDEDLEDDGGEEDDSDADEEMSPPNTSSKNHLPDHLFASAFASTPSTKKSLRTPVAKPMKTKKRKRSTPGAKDLVVGSRTLRIASASTISRPVPATLPSRKIRKFTDRALSLKATAATGRGKKNAKGWERVPANLGVLRRTTHGPPAAGFVRNPGL
ncbi:hypothetical protein MSAN_01615900 [Mycena sanguinolenta]|uniref:Uncharacterized protein n=1 Tax=Mycena sanguinolenta TaxID=230812 RepID=A0A8H7CWA8_9AGAR|nr:hypothetical protein MSAN_01615900 [Mycena sanguinolenta]